MNRSYEALSFRLRCSISSASRDLCSAALRTLCVARRLFDPAISSKTLTVYQYPYKKMSKESMYLVISSTCPWTVGSKAGGAAFDALTSDCVQRAASAASSRVLSLFVCTP
jgi:hypothetical protein